MVSYPFLDSPPIPLRPPYWPPFRGPFFLNPRHYPSSSLSFFVSFSCYGPPSRVPSFFSLFFTEYLVKGVALFLRRYISRKIRSCLTLPFRIPFFLSGASFPCPFFIPISFRCPFSPTSPRVWRFFSLEDRFADLFSPFLPFGVCLLANAP